MVTQADIDDRKAEWGEDSPLYVASILGQFPDDLEDSIVPLSAVMAATQREPGDDNGGPVVYGLDVAREGDDKTVLVRRQGQVASILWRARERDLMQIVGRVARICSQERVDYLVVDDVGLGGGVTDRLRELQGQLAREAQQLLAEGDTEDFGKSLRETRIVAFKGGAAARDKADFVNLSAECWWATRKWLLEAGGCLPNDPALIGQLSSRRFKLQSDQRIVLESKKATLKAGGKSPDEADALTMTFGTGRGGVKIWV
tara:strand:+ start:39 stop:812 length:774 start_codon:yes stop_codon:yes gene_type:complete